jgi:hypothetical protein
LEAINRLLGSHRHLGNHRHPLPLNAGSGVEVGSGHRISSLGVAITAGGRGPLGGIAPIATGILGGTGPDAAVGNLVADVGAGKEGARKTAIRTEKGTGHSLPRRAWLESYLHQWQICCFVTSRLMIMSCCYN